MCWPNTHQTTSVDDVVMRKMWNQRTWLATAPSPWRCRRPAPPARSTARCARRRRQVQLLVRQRLQIGPTAPPPETNTRVPSSAIQPRERRRPGDGLARVQIGEPAWSRSAPRQTDHRADRDGDEAAVGFHRGMIQTASASASSSCASVWATKKTPAQRSGVAVREIIATVIHSSTPSRAPARPRKRTRPSRSCAPWRSRSRPRRTASARRRSTSAAARLEQRAGQGGGDAHAQDLDHDHQADVELVRRWLRPPATSSTEITPSTSRELTPTPSALAASSGVSAGPIAS